MLGALLISSKTGCGQNDVQVHRVGKEAPEPQTQAQTAAMPSGQADIPGAGPELHWKTPAGWEEVTPGEMRLASFRVAGKDGKLADVSIVPLPGLAGSDVGNVNRWRAQVGLPPVPAEALPKLVQTVEIGGLPGQLYDQAGTNKAQAAVNVSMSVSNGGGLLANVNRWRGQLGLAPMAESNLHKQLQTFDVPGGRATLVDMSGREARSGQKARLIGAIVERGSRTWFYKLMGDAQVVEQEKGPFTKFVGGVKYPDDR